MPTSQPSTRQRLVYAALELFAAQGVTATTTKQIAELSGVNEVTLFRQFGNKHGLLLSVIEETAIFTQFGQTFVQQATQTGSIHQALMDYATACLQALDRVPEIVRSIIGEAGQFPLENREALGRGVTQVNHTVAEYFATVIDREQLQTHLPIETLVSLLNATLLGYAIFELTGESHTLWRDRNDFLENLVTLFLESAISYSSELSAEAVQASPYSAQLDLSTSKFEITQIADLPADLVHSILQQVKKLGLQEYALVYVLFGAGLNPKELISLERSHHISTAQQQVLQITTGNIRQVPVNQWIMGKRYGSYNRNPLTRWLKSRTDDHSALFLNQLGEPLSEAELRQQWQAWTKELKTPEGNVIAIEQTHQTWCIDMLVRGISVENLSILAGRDAIQLQPYINRLKERNALEQAVKLDQKS